MVCTNFRKQTLIDIMFFTKLIIRLNLHVCRECRKTSSFTPISNNLQQGLFLNQPKSIPFSVSQRRHTGFVAPFSRCDLEGTGSLEDLRRPRDFRIKIPNAHLHRAPRLFPTERTSVWSSLQTEGFFQDALVADESSYMGSG